MYNKDTTASTVLPTQMVCTGWQIRGWSPQTTPTGMVVESPLSIANSTHLYGTYQRVIQVTFNSNGGGTPPAPISGTQWLTAASLGTPTPIVITLPASPDRPGFEFSGWMDEITKVVYSPGTNIPVDSARMFSATWTLS